MSTWQYKRINAYEEFERASLEPESNMPVPVDLTSVDVTEWVLNHYGSDGWELVCVTVLPGGHEYAYMRRANNP